MVKFIAVLWLLFGFAGIVNTLTYPGVSEYPIDGLIAYVIGIMGFVLPVFVLPFWLAWRK